MQVGQSSREDRLAVAVGRWAFSTMRAEPWGSALGLARTVLALGSIGTLVLTPTRILLAPTADGVVPPLCVGAGRAGLWCVIAPDHPIAATVTAVVLLGVVASGWRPRVTGVVHWWVSWSMIIAFTSQDGGDQITAVLTLLLIPVTLTDARRWHWAPPPARPAVSTARVIGYVSLWLVHLQVAGIYFVAAVSKFTVPEWADGTALYYWLNNSIFHAPGYLQPITDALTRNGAGVTALTYGSLALELVLGVAIFFPRPVKIFLLPFGLLLHDSIALTMGLTSFDFAMSGALLLYLLPIGHQMRRPCWWRPTVEALHRWVPGALAGRLSSR